MVSLLADTKKEHYVPRCYLINFENINGRINVFDKVKMEQRSQSKEEIAHENYFYDLDFEKQLLNFTSTKQEEIKRDIKKLTGENDWEKIKSIFLNPKYVEKGYLCPIEGLYDQLLKRIISKNSNVNEWVIKKCYSFSEEDKSLLSLFLAIQIIRTKAFRDTISQTYEKLLQTLAYKQQMNDKDALSKEEFAIKADKEFIKLEHISMMLDEENTTQFAEILANHHWMLYVNTTNTPFFTSDNPVSTIPHKQNKFMSSGALNSEGVEVVFPISPNLLLAMYERRMYSSLVKDRSYCIIKESKYVDYFNRAQIINSLRCVFSPSDNFDLAKEVCTEYPQIRDSDNRVSVN